MYVTRMLPEPAIDLLKESCRVEINPFDRVLSKDELRRGLRAATPSCAS